MMFIHGVSTGALCHSAGKRPQPRPTVAFRLHRALMCGLRCSRDVAYVLLLPLSTLSLPSPPRPSNVTFSANRPRPCLSFLYSLHAFLRPTKGPAFRFERAVPAGRCACQCVADEFSETLAVLRLHVRARTQACTCGSVPSLLIGLTLRSLHCAHLTEDILTAATTLCQPDLSPRRGPWAGFRFGEALHPGPQADLRRYFPVEGSPPPAQTEPAQQSPVTDCCTFAVVNPTSVLHKAKCFEQLGADVLILSETSAVEHAQRMTTSAMRPLQFKCLCVPCHRRGQRRAFPPRTCGGCRYYVPLTMPCCSASNGKGRP